MQGQTQQDGTITVQIQHHEGSGGLSAHLPKKVRDKIAHNIYRVQLGERNAELFKKLDGTDIWEFRTLYEGNAYRLFAFLGHTDGHARYCHARHQQENAENPCRRDSESREIEERVFQDTLKRTDMKQEMELIPFEDLLTEFYGEVGTPERDKFEQSVAEAVHASRIGEAVREARTRQNLTQEQLGERIGVKKAQISRIERGYSITIPTMSRVFKALGVTTASLDLGKGFGKVALW